MIQDIEVNIPENNWASLVSAAADTFLKVAESLVPLQSILGRHFSENFNRLTDGEKVLFAAVLKEASQINRQKTEILRPDISVVIEIMEASRGVTDEDLRACWVNLLANEMTGKNVHPRHAVILSRLTAQDVHTLKNTSVKSHTRTLREAINEHAGKYSIISLIPFISIHEPSDLSTDILVGLGLIKRVRGVWKMTHLGTDFLLVIRDVDSNH